MQIELSGLCFLLAAPGPCIALAGQSPIIAMFMQAKKHRAQAKYSILFKKSLKFKFGQLKTDGGGLNFSKMSQL